MEQFIKKNHKRWIRQLNFEGLTTHDAEDVLQNVYLALYKWLAKGKTVKNKEGLMRSLILRARADFFRRQYNMPFVDVDVEGESHSAEDTFASIEELNSLIDDFSGRKNGGVLYDVLVEQHTYKQAAAKHETTVRNVKQIVHRWRKEALD